MDVADIFSNLGSWSDFAARVSALESHARGLPFELLVKHYLASKPTYRSKLKHVWLLKEVPTDISRRLRLPLADQGIDLIAETHVGEFWAIQAKYRTDPNASLTHRELATFTSLAFTVCQNISYGLVCTTTARIPGILTGLSNLGDLTNDIWAELDVEFFSDLRDSLVTGSRPADPRARTHLPHQTRAIASAITHFRDKGESRGKLISPCGSGKSLTACWIAQALVAKRVLIAVPSIALIRQTLESWMQEALSRGEAADWLCVCSDHDAGKTDRAELVAHVHELGIPCDTRPEVLEQHLGAMRDRPEQVVVITTYQSSPVLAAAAKAAGFDFDFAVLDEAHRTTGQKAKSFAHLLFDDNLALPRRLFMTATERRFQGSSDDVVSMDDPALYGSAFEVLSFKAAIVATPPILCDYRILTIGVRESEVARLVETNRWLNLGTDGLDEITAQALASLIALRRATSEHGVQHTVSFHSSIARADQFRDLCARLNANLSDETPIAPFHVNGKMGSAARQRELTAFLDHQPSLITNARCLTEGVDVPRIDCVFFADPKGSTIEIVQAAGRALRLAPGKTRGYILLPLVVKDGATLDEVTETSAFKFVLFVLRALATHDERIVEWFRATAEGRTPEVSSLVHFDFDQVLDPLDVDSMEFTQQIQVRCWEIIVKLKYLPFEDARDWARKSGINKQPDWVRSWKAGKIPRDIPQSPESVYDKKGWIDWGDFLGFRRPATRKTVLAYDQAREFVIALGIQHGTEWREYARRGMPGKASLPANIPRNPQQTYHERGWINWAHWLGKEQAVLGAGNDGAELLPFGQARSFARSLKLSGQRAWRQYCAGRLPNLPQRIPGVPAGPEFYYKDHGWLDYGDWLGNGQSPPRKRNYRPYLDACIFVCALGLRSHGEWALYSKGNLEGQPPIPADIPRHPNQTYAADGFSWGTWLGVELA
ncbi:MAG: DEAD/DEAH box helicase family protein [Candidatus Didemnitutus sp.]|nr:DEAD/DEAH box helicase family protein [Candidatus Didemnitutus sp.]